ncbi:MULTISPECIES: vanadium-dependent haloperoxidase [unclassified Streptomyces]|uniref:vanadium-dependent haloperoxidase n=1 Tax=unclassified Streptomyces TaxID=2593676 RepID=UPI002E2FB1AE|nr:vanadium-dependent haloperoxidase [Streptomyces sp. NBC_01268]
MSQRPVSTPTTPAARTPLTRRRVLTASAAAAGAFALASGTSTAWAAAPVAQFEAETRTGRRAPGAGAEPSVVVRWNQAAMDAILGRYQAAGNRFGPATVNARALAIIHNCIYDAWACYDRVAGGTRYGGSLRRPRAERTLDNKNEAISYAAHLALLDLFPEYKVAIDSMLSSLGYDPALTDPAPKSPAWIGRRTAQAVLAYRHGDGANQLGTPAYGDTTGYQSKNPPQTAGSFDPSIVVSPEHWSPLIVGGKTQRYLTPQFAVMKPFALSRPDQFTVAAPPAYPSVRMTAAIEELLDISANLTDEQKCIAEFWLNDDVTPPGAQQMWGRFVSARDGHDVDEDAKLFFGLNMAECDAAIGSWAVKAQYDFARPSTLIPYDRRGQRIQAWGGPGLGTVAMDGVDWQAYVAVPPFPATVSGHSTFSGAAAEFLRRFTGTDAFGDSYRFKAGASTVEPGLTPRTDTVLTWPTFSEAARQAGISRVYGGMHWSFDNEPGIEMGHRIGRVVYRQAECYFTGTHR